MKVILWIIIGIVYLLARKKKAVPPPPRHQRDPEEAQPEETVPVPKSFEELLREIEGMKKPLRPEPEPEVVDYEDNLGPEERGLEEVTPSYRRDDEQANQVYEEAKRQAFYRPSLEETVKLEDTVVRFSQFKGYTKETKKNVLQEYVKDLREPESFRKAFILSEILRPKF